MSYLDLMIDAAIKAGSVVSEVYDRGVVALAKSDGSPVTEADHRAEALILQALEPTGIPVLAEESVAAGHIPALGKRFFAVDPLDGTKEFLKRNGEFTVNIALVEHGRPVAGVVLAPASGDIFWGGPEGARCALVSAGGLSDIRPVVAGGHHGVRVVTSRSHGHAAMQALLQRLHVADHLIAGSSLKFCLIARGEAELYPRFNPTSEWDTAAGQAVLEAAGGAVLTLDGGPLAYGKSEHGFINPSFVAAADQTLALRAAEAMLPALETVHTGG